jgi:hypothetical protein
MLSSIYYVLVVLGECYRMNFHPGKLFTIISLFGDLYTEENEFKDTL